MTLYLGNQKVCPTRTVNGGGGERYLIQASDESMLPDWYRIYSDGWCEQGGIAIIEPNSTEVEVNLLFEYIYRKNVYPDVQITGTYASKGTVTPWLPPDENNWTSGLYPSTGLWAQAYYYIVRIVSSTANMNRMAISWETKGFIDLSQLEENE